MKLVVYLAKTSLSPINPPFINKPAYNRHITDNIIYIQMTAIMFSFRVKFKERNPSSQELTNTNKVRHQQNIMKKNKFKRVSTEQKSTLMFAVSPFYPNGIRHIKTFRRSWKRRQRTVQKMMISHLLQSVASFLLIFGGIYADFTNLNVKHGHFDGV